MNFCIPKIQKEVGQNYKINTKWKCVHFAELLSNPRPINLIIDPISNIIFSAGEVPDPKFFFFIVTYILIESFATNMTFLIFDMLIEFKAKLWIVVYKLTKAAWKLKLWISALHICTCGCVNTNLGPPSFEPWKNMPRE